VLYLFLFLYLGCIQRRAQSKLNTSSNLETNILPCYPSSAMPYPCVHTSQAHLLQNSLPGFATQVSTLLVESYCGARWWVYWCL